LTGKRLGVWVVEAVLPSFNAFLKQVFVIGAQSGYELALCVKDQTLNVQIDASVSDDEQECRLVLIDMTPIKAHEGDLEHIAHYDSLTGLPNRLLLSDRIHQAMAHCQRHEQCLAVVYLDLDNIKAVNDQHGHAVGDALLIEVSKRMQAALLDSDTLARMGGDEFVAVLGELSKSQDSLPVVERLLSAASSTLMLRTQHQEGQLGSELLLQISVSIGVTF
jgi:diguanylate cyclase (GGDEF)-like protein